MRVLFYNDENTKVVAEVNKVEAFSLNDQNHFTFEIEGCVYTFVSFRFFDVTEFLSREVLDFTRQFKRIDRLEDKSLSYVLDKDNILTEDK